MCGENTGNLKEEGKKIDPYGISWVTGFQGQFYGYKGSSGDLRAMVASLNELI